MAELRERREERTLGDLFAELSQEVSTLVRQEIQLAKVEMTQKASRAGKNIAFIALGGAVIYAGFLALVLALIAGLAEFLAVWLAALLVGLVVAGIGYILVQKGLSELKNINPAPRRTIETLRENKEWVKQQIQ